MFESIVMRIFHFIGVLTQNDLGAVQKGVACKNTISLYWVPVLPGSSATSDMKYRFQTLHIKGKMII